MATNQINMYDYENDFMGIGDCIGEIKPLNAKNQEEVITIYLNFSENSKQKLAEINRTKRSIEKNSRLSITHLAADEKDLAHLEVGKMYTGTFSTLVKTNNTVLGFEFKIASFCFEFSKYKNGLNPTAVSNAYMTILQKDECITVTAYEQ